MTGLAMIPLTIQAPYESGCIKLFIYETKPKTYKIRKSNPSDDRMTCMLSSELVALVYAEKTEAESCDH